MRDSIATSRFLLGISIVMYVVSLFFAGFHSDRGTTQGWEALLEGFMPAIFGVIGIFRFDFTYFGTISWLANSAIALAWLLAALKVYKGAMGSSAAAIFLGLLFLTVNTIPIPDAQTMSSIHAGVGYYLWLGSMFFALMSGAALDPATQENA